MRAAFGIYGGEPSPSGVVVNEFTAFKFEPFYSAINLVSQDLGTCGVKVYGDDGGRKAPARDHYLYPILHSQPNPEMSAVVFWMTYVAHLLSWGNAYAQIEWNRAGRAKSLWPLAPDRMKPFRDSRDGMLRYRYQRPQGERIFEAYEVLHTPGLGYDGLVGYSPVAMAARGPIATGMAAETFSERFYGNNAQPGLVLQTDQPLPEATAKQITANWRQIHGGLKGEKGVGLLHSGLKVAMMGMPLVDAQHIESRTWTVQQVARIYRIPPHMLAEMSHATFTNIEHQGINYARNTLRPWAELIEDVIQVKLIGVGSQYEAEFNLDALMRGSLLERTQAHKEAILSGQLTPNEARALENRAAQEGGDELLVQAQMVPLRMAGKQEPAAAPVPARMEHSFNHEMKVSHEPQQFRFEFAEPAKRYKTLRDESGRITQLIEE